MTAWTGIALGSGMEWLEVANWRIHFRFRWRFCVSPLSSCSSSSCPSLISNGVDHFNFGSAKTLVYKSFFCGRTFGASISAHEGNGDDRNQIQFNRFAQCVDQVSFSTVRAGAQECSQRHVQQVAVQELAFAASCLSEEKSTISV